MSNDFSDYETGEFVAGVADDGSYRPAWNTCFVARVVELKSSVSNGYRVGILTLEFIDGTRGSLELGSSESSKLRDHEYSKTDWIVFYCSSLKSPKTNGWYGRTYIVGSLDKMNEAINAKTKK